MYPFQNLLKDYLFTYNTNNTNRGEGVLGLKGCQHHLVMAVQRFEPGICLIKRNLTKLLK